MKYPYSDIYFRIEYFQNVLNFLDKLYSCAIYVLAEDADTSATWQQQVLNISVNFTELEICWLFERELPDEFRRCLGNGFHLILLSK